MKQSLTTILRGRVRRGGFTLTELLVVIGIIGILVTIGLVVSGKALRSSRRAATQGLLSSIGAAVESFRADFDRFPPLVTRLDRYGDTGPNAIATPEVLAAEPGLTPAERRTRMREANAEARFYSNWTLAAYLMGVGDLNGDGDDDEDLLYLDDGQEGFGIRHIGAFGAWKQLDSRQELVHLPKVGFDEETGDRVPVGREYGPYLEPGSTERYIERVPVRYDSGDKRIVPDEASEQVMFRFVDAWGNPIRYYKDWLTHDPRDNSREASVDFAPYELRSFEGMLKQFDNDLEEGDISVDAHVTRAPYMLLSAGGDPLATFQSGPIRRVVSPFGDVLPKGLNAETAEIMWYEQSFGSSGAPDKDFADLSTSEQEQILEMIESNVRYAP